MEQKIIFLDIDGTLTEPGTNEPPKSAIWAIRQAQKEGHYVFLCTGRNYDMLQPLLKYNFDGVIASSGGYIECKKNVIYDCPMTEEQKRAAMDILKENGVFRTVECMDGSYTDAEFKEFLREHAAEGGNSELLRWREQIEKALNILPMEEYRGQPVYKIVVMSPSREQLFEPQKLLEPDFTFCIQDANEGGFINGEVVNRKFDKGKAVERVCEYFHIPTRNAVAIGDSMNDREMLETAGLSICMENGSEELKKLVDDICPSVQKDGIRDAFLKHHLITGHCKL
ncbi:MAG: HAD family hydrolase [Lachnospiraceae bacterium]|nr:HAD family hydrolase [Lachnospiraceae bacterium]